MTWRISVRECGSFFRELRLLGTVESGTRPVETNRTDGVESIRGGHVLDGPVPVIRSISNSRSWSGRVGLQCPRFAVGMSQLGRQLEFRKRPV